MLKRNMVIMLMYHVVQSPMGMYKGERKFYNKKILAKLDLILVKYKVKLEGKLMFAFGRGMI